MNNSIHSLVPGVEALACNIEPKILSMAEYKID